MILPMNDETANFEPTSDLKKIIAVVIPSYRVRAHILQLLARIGPEVDQIFVVDDACPEGSGALVLAQIRDQRVTVITHEQNQGVGGAVITGYRFAVEAGADVVVKLDGDGQMDPALINEFVNPIIKGKADYVKGNRFFNVEDVASMPKVRLLGNGVLSFMNKISTGYWKTFDPTNGYTAISSIVISHLPLNKLSRRYFFESDILFRLNLINAAVSDLQMKAFYGDEKSNLKISRIFLPFFIGHIRNFLKRLLYNYFIRDFSIASLEVLSGLAFILFGILFGGYHWMVSVETGIPATTGTVMLAALPIFLGVQFVLASVAYDVSLLPNQPVGPLLKRNRLDGELLPRVRSAMRCEK